ncbi:fimbrial protein, partial [Klebsiella sp. 142732]
SVGEISVKTGNNARNGGKNSLNRLIRCVCGKKIGPDPRNFNQRVSLGRNDLLIRTFPNTIQESAIILPQPDSGFGIAISPNASMHPLIEMNAPIHFTLATGATLASTYTAGLLWLSRTPKLGPFSATAKITVTFE